MTDLLHSCRWCGKPTEPLWSEREERDFNTRGLKVWRKATFLVKMEELPDENAPRIGFSFTIDADLAKHIDERTIADLVSKEIGKLREKIA